MLSAQDRTARTPGLTVEAEVQVPPEEIAPDFPPVDLNTAGLEELDTLPGIGEALARRIIAWREANGPFASKEQLMEVSGIGEAKYAELEDRITVGDADNDDGGDTADEDPGGR